MLFFRGFFPRIPIPRLETVMDNADSAGARVTSTKLLVGLCATVGAAVLVWLVWNSSPFHAVQQRVAQADGSGEQAAVQLGERQRAVMSPPYEPVSVPTNRLGDVPAGFRGDVHPLLHGKTSLEVVAHWTEVGRGRDHLETEIAPAAYALFTDLKPAMASTVYTERDFSGLLPESIESVGQLWEIESDVAANFLRQFHPQPAMHLISLGRRAGPDGAFGILRAVSATHLDILFRIHAEFDISLNMWYTPACFWGQMIVDREAGTVRSFRLWLPTDQPLNVHLTVAGPMPRGAAAPAIDRKIEAGLRVGTRRDIVHVDQMELTSANRELAGDLDWPESIDEHQARRELQKAFYAFASINWVPWETALAAAHEQHKPILAIVLWGALDDQSC
jgi:hypothetical protein